MLNRVKNFSKLKTALKSYQFVSDLHLNFNNFPRLKPISPNLIVAGDLADGWDKWTNSWLKSIAPSFDQIIVVPGNHDFYYRSFHKTLDRMRQTEASLDNLTILNNDTHLYQDQNDDQFEIAIYGTPLWSYIPEQHHKYYQTSCQEFKWIYSSNKRLLTPKDYNMMHMNELINLRQFLLTFDELQKDSDKVVIPVVVTHHAPLIKGCCHPHYYQQGRLKHKNHMFCTDLSNTLKQFGQEQELFWIFGHTHYHTNIYYHGVYLGSNPVGFQRQPKNKVGIKVRDRTLYDLYKRHQDNKSLQDNEPGKSDAQKQVELENLMNLITLAILSLDDN